MAYQFVLFAAIVTAAKASLLEGPVVPAPVVPVPVARTIVAEPYDPNPHYSYGYDVQDPLTGDSHGQVETRNGDVVTGSYNLLEADGTRRVVDYTADPINGFNAVVSRRAPVVVAKVAPVAAVAPLVKAAPYLPAPAPVVPVAAAPVPAPILRSAPVTAVPAPVFRSAPYASVVPAAPWTGAPVLRSALPAGPWQGSVGPWQGSTVFRSTPVW